MAEEATPGPWRSDVKLTPSGQRISIYQDGRRSSSDHRPAVGHGDLARADARFIASARTALPWLCDLLLEMVNRVEQLEKSDEEKRLLRREESVPTRQGAASPSISASQDRPTPVIPLNLAQAEPAEEEITSEVLEASDSEANGSEADATRNPVLVDALQAIREVLQRDVLPLMTGHGLRVAPDRAEAMKQAFAAVDQALRDEGDNTPS